MLSLCVESVSQEQGFSIQENIIPSIIMQRKRAAQGLIEVERRKLKHWQGDDPH